MRLSKSFHLPINYFIYYSYKYRPAFRWDHCGLRIAFYLNKPFEQDRENLRNLMSRDEVRSMLEMNGLTVEQAQERVDSLTDSEVQQMAKKFDELPCSR